MLLNYDFLEFESGYPKVFDEVVSNKLIANALITQKVPSDTSHDDDLD
ncbi:hypothetical protein KVM71_03245 [Helicobacter pylori]|nr:hypothetical protein KVM71_03245 [Helicobacter pylori]